MKQEQRMAIKEKIIEAVEKITENLSNRMSEVTIGGHKIARRLVYAGGSQWSGCDREWDEIENGWCWVVNDSHTLSTPKLFGSNGRNMIERQTGYYLQSGYDPHSVPNQEDGDLLNKVPDSVLIEIGSGIVEAKKNAANTETDQQKMAEALIFDL